MNISKYFNGEGSFLKNILVTIFIGGLISFLNYLFNIYIARNLGNSDFGLYTAAIGIIYLVQIPAAAIQTAITKKVAQKKNFNLEKFKINSTIQLSIVAVILSILFIVFGDLVASFASIPKQYILPLAIALFGSVISTIPKGFLLGLEKIIVLNIILLFETVLKFVMGYVAISHGLDITLPILANVLPSIITLILVLPFISTRSIEIPKEKISLQYKGLILLFITFLLLNMPFTLDLILVNPDVRPAYGALSLIGKIVFFASTMIASVMISRLANQEDKLRKKTILISLVVATGTGLVISTVYFFFTDLIVNIVFNGMYSEISQYITLYGIGMTAYSVSYMVVNSLLIRESYVHIIFLTILTVLQFILYQINNETLKDAFTNQLIVFGSLLLFIVIVLTFYIFKKNGKDNREG
jgi:O-antigen/teichoic acid export membrane protein